MSGEKARSAKAPFADTAAPKDRAKGSRRAAERRREAYGRLVASDDFKEFMFETLFALCAFEHDMRETSDFEDGIRSAGSYIRRSLLVADGAPQFFADLDKRYYAGVRRGIVEAQNRDNGNEGSR